MNAITIDTCSDPYDTGCRGQATGFMIGQSFNWETSEFEPIKIFTCKDCAYWNCDWDWANEPEGPTLVKKRKKC